MNIRAKLATAAAALVLFSNTIAANNSNPYTTDVKLVSNAANEPMFQVNVNNRNTEKLTLLVKNAEGEVLYRETFNGASYSKKFQVVVYDPGTVKLTFVVTDNKGYSTSFEANNEVRTTEEFVITKL